MYIYRFATNEINNISKSKSRYIITIDTTVDPRGVLHNFQYGEVHANILEVHANIWGPKFYVESIFGVCELQHGQKFNILGP